MRRILLYIGLIICLNACESPYDLAIESTPKIVVDGRLTTEESRVRLSYSNGFSVDNQTYAPIKGASVIVEDFSGRGYVFLEQSAGTYIAPDDLQVTLGETYILTVNVDGIIIRSKPEKLNANLPFDLEAQFVEDVQSSDQNNLISRYGHNIVANIVSNLPKDNYFRWVRSATWEHPYTYEERFSPLTGAFNITSTNELIDANQGQFTIYFQLNQNMTYSQAIGFAIDPAELEEDDYFGMLTPDNQQRILDSLTTVNNTTPVKQFGYRITMEQHAISRTAYEYWRQVQLQQQNTGSVFDSQPATITGNLFAVESQEPILGFFSVSSVAKKEIELFYLMDRER